MKGHRRMPSIHGVQGRRKKLAGKELEAALDDWGKGEARLEGDARAGILGSKNAARVNGGEHSAISGKGREECAANVVTTKPEKRKRGDGEMAGKTKKIPKYWSPNLNHWWAGEWLGRNLPYWAVKVLGAGK